MNKRLLFFLIIPLSIILDQWSKYLIKTNMLVGESQPVVENILHISYVQNTGAAFSILQGKTLLLTWVTSIALFLLIIYLVKSIKLNPPLASGALSMIIGGGIGNLIDRWQMGYVVDFIDFRVFPVFNVADIFVTSGCVLLILTIIVFEVKENGKKNN